ncbi:phosphotransferase enzyme family protein [Nocardioides flavus (ex Wang et al. 2016)]|uniref:phosphotransferase enzyme family protein n=1 Tax=Nocardioides flavus (ex Wang et al. 2016) TaxID=2058780 RepID=UPI001749DEAE|nr:phosphotransferase [Nocardioides flavus (ex Wang et al. 2016)]
MQHIEPLPRGIKNLNFRVRVGDAEWVLKRHPAAARARLSDSHRFEVRLAESGFPVAPLRRAASGATVVETREGVFDLHSWVSGRQFSIADRGAMHAEHPDLASRLGSVMGDLHREGQQALDGVPGLVPATALPTTPYPAIATVRRGLFQRLQASAKLLRRRRTPLDAWFEQILPDIVHRAESCTLPQVAARVDPADAILAHNDVNWENLVFGPSLEVLAVLDFDNARTLPRALEIGAAAVVLIGTDAARFERFMESYARTARTRPDPRAVRLGMELKCVRSILWSIDAHARGRVADGTMLETWCRHLEADLRVLTAMRADDRW